MESFCGGASPSPSPGPGAGNLGGEEASRSPIEGFLCPEGPTVSRPPTDMRTEHPGAAGGSSSHFLPGDRRTMEVRPEHKQRRFAEMKIAHGLSTGGSSSPDRRSVEGRPDHKRRRFAEGKATHGAPTVELPATPCTSRALLHPKVEWEQEEIRRPPPKQPEVIPPAPLKQEEEDIPAAAQEKIPTVAAPAPEGGKPWPPKLRRIARDRMFTHLPPGVPTKIGDDSNLKLAAAELQRRMGTSANLDHLTGSQQVATLLQLGYLHQRSPTFLMNRFSDYCDGHPMAHPSPPPPPPQKLETFRD